MNLNDTTEKFKGNKGELSELYVFFHLLGEGRIISADENLEKTSEFVEIVSILRNDSQRLTFSLEKNEVNIDDGISTLLKFPQSQAKILSNQILFDIQNHPKLQDTTKAEILSKLVTKVSEKSTKKGDIEIVIYDPRHGISSCQEFSIKSFLGSKPTLFNAHVTTNIIYEITDNQGESMQLKNIDRINSINSRHKYKDRVQSIIEEGFQLKYYSYQEKIFKLNLQIIDSDLPKIIAHVVLSKFRDGIIKITDVIANLKKKNPMKYDLSMGHRFYEYRIINFLVESALGMTSKTPWSGEFQVIGGILIIKPTAEVLCYHLIDFNKFKTYLKNSCKVDSPSGSKMKYGKIYKGIDGKSFIKLNFQIRV